MSIYDTMCNPPFNELDGSKIRPGEDEVVMVHRRAERVSECIPRVKMRCQKKTRLLRIPLDTS